MDGQGNKGPSVAELQRFVRDKTLLEFLLVNGERVSGTLRWFDENAFGVADGSEKQTTLLRTAVVSYSKNNA